MKEKIINYQFYHWGPFLYRTQVDKECLEKIRKLCKKKKKKDYRKNLAGLLKQEYGIDKNKVFLSLSAYFNSYIKASVEHYSCSYSGTKIIMESAWVNYMVKNEINPLHTHSKDLSFVLFIKVPKNLKKEIEETVSSDSKPGSVNFVNDLKDNKFYISANNFVPEVGDLFIFPASLHHYVNSFKSNGERVSVSGNLEIKK